MPHHPEQNVLRKVFILFVCLDIVGAKSASCKEEALALECRHSSGLLRDSPVGRRSREGADTGFRSRMNPGNSAAIRFFAAAVSFSPAPSWFVHWPRSSKVTELLPASQ